jgi:uncharacterized protein (DUF433 family)
MQADIQIIDRGRGPQLSTSRITVQDLVPYFQEGCSHEEILRWIPSLTSEEIAAVQHYYLEHKEALDEEDRQIQEQHAQRKNPPEIERIREAGRAKMQVLREQLQRAKTDGVGK